ncbi:hypothetical protein AYL99_10852 [Fonsecaea erecta]|uniref:Uncharacterized protein n=1 Tax=Fonsecaea erecta TaxID=1367422 RepID=A0A178Z614_9EURO|nr:hypothetical protein AYL99_10852 [Fonsecaea erecta]OAP55152.1 hypothetical protein AYL99_10852 [Fonsecaea erecta]
MLFMKTYTYVDGLLAFANEYPSARRHLRAAVAGRPTLPRLRLALLDHAGDRGVIKRAVGGDDDDDGGGGGAAAAGVLVITGVVVVLLVVLVVLVEMENHAKED